jgi:molybdenum cofactor cytidylyltransferase
MKASPNCFAIILAAGRSSRMGREKAGLPWLDGRPLLHWMAEALLASGWEPRVILGPQHIDEWRRTLPEEWLVLNPNPEEGKTTSIAVGAADVPDSAEWILISSVDQPRPPALYRRLWDETRMCQGNLIVPERAGRRDHPVVLRGSLRTKLLTLSEDADGLRGLLNAQAANIRLLADCMPEWLGWDLNTPTDYEEALQYFQHLPEVARRPQDRREARDY